MPFNLTRAFAGAFTKDTETRLIIPTTEALVSGLISSFGGALEDLLTGENLGGSLTNAIDTTLLTLGVTGIELNGELVAPTSKGIGSVGEILHLLGSKLEEVRMEFTTDLYPGPLANVLRTLIRTTLDNADLVYIVDDLLSVAPGIITKYKLRKVGKIKTAIMGEFSFKLLRVGGLNNAAGLAASALIGIGASAISNLESELSQQFTFMTDILTEKSRRG